MDILVYNKLPREALDIRITVFVDEQGFVDEVDATDSVATHLLMFDGEKAVATCRIFESEEKNRYILGRLCVLRDYRGRGLGSEMVAAAERAAAKLGGRTLALHSQYHAKDFYARLGYREAGDLEYEQGQPHIWMEKKLGGNQNDQIR